MSIRSHVSPAENNRVCSQVKEALRKGILVKPSACAWCGCETQRIDGHHPDYDRPLMVVWLCVPCHKAHHRAYADERRMIRTGVFQ